MAVFAYRAATADFAPVQGTIAADTPRQARDLLRARGLRVEHLTDADPGRARRGWQPFAKGVRDQSVSALRDLATLLGVGIPLLEALDVLLRQYTGRLGTSLLRVRDRVAEGRGLADTLAEQPHYYDSLVVHMVEVGEHAGNLDEVLESIASFKEKSLELKDRVVSAILYPCIVLVAAVGVTVFLMTVVVPMLLENLLDAGRQLPWPTRVLKGASDILVNHGAFVATVVIGLLVAVGWAIRLPRGRWIWHGLLLKLPMVGEMARKQSIGRGAMVISVLMRSGIEFLKAIEIAGRTMKNVVLQDALIQSSRDVAAGQEIGTALERTGMFPPVVIQVFSVGQQTGQLESMLHRLATDYERQVALRSARLAAVLEPVLILLLSVLVGFILFATILPILEAGNVL